MKILMSLVFVVFMCGSAFASSISGKVVDAKGQIVEGTRVMITPVCLTCSRQMPIAVKTDAEGLFKVRCKEGGYLIRVSAKEGKASDRVRVLKDENADVNLVLVKCCGREREMELNKLGCKKCGN